MKLFADFHLFALAILGTVACQNALAPQALAILKHFVQAVASGSSSSGAVNDSITVQVRCFLKQLLVIYLNAQEQRSEVRLVCIKNVLLACTIVLTGGTNAITISGDAAVDQLLDEMIGCLYNMQVCISACPLDLILPLKCHFPHPFFLFWAFQISPPPLPFIFHGLTKIFCPTQTSSIAANCIRRLLLNTPRTSTDAYVVRRLLPRLTVFITSAPDTDDQAATVAHVCRTLTSFVATLDAPQIPLALGGVVVPALILRAEQRHGAEHDAPDDGHDDGRQPHHHRHRHSRHRQSAYADTAARLLELAAANPAAFRATVNALGAEQRAAMEKIIREGGGAAGSQSAEAAAAAAAAAAEEKEELQRRLRAQEPSIALKMDFGL
jgi:hypothetical protein